MIFETATIFIFLKCKIRVGKLKVVCILKFPTLDFLIMKDYKGGNSNVIFYFDTMIIVRKILLYTTCRYFFSGSD